MKQKAIVICAFKSVDILRSIFESIRTSAISNSDLRFVFTDNPDKVFDIKDENILIFSDEKFFRTHLTGSSLSDHLSKTNTVVAIVVKNVSVYTKDMREFLLLIDMLADELSISKYDKPFEAIVRVLLSEYMARFDELSQEVTDKELQIKISETLVNA